MQAHEEQLLVTTPDKKTIYCTLGCPAGKEKGMVIFVHGLAANDAWPPLLLGSWFFRSKGYAYCRINLYDWRPGARTMMASDLLQHAKDTDTVVKQLQKLGFENIFAVGHSYGGLTMLQTKTSAFKAISLWEISSFISYPPEQWFKKDPKTGVTYLTSAAEVLLSKRYLNGIKNFPNELSLISKIKAPTQICYASQEGAWLIESSKRYFGSVKAQKELVAVPAINHSFTEEGATSVLFKKTEKWFAKNK